MVWDWTFCSICSRRCRIGRTVNFLDDVGIEGSWMDGIKPVCRPNLFSLSEWTFLNVNQVIDSCCWWHWPKWGGQWSWRENQGQGPAGFWTTFPDLVVMKMWPNIRCTWWYSTSCLQWILQITTRNFFYWFLFYRHLRIFNISLTLITSVSTEVSVISLVCRRS